MKRSIITITAFILGSVTAILGPTINGKTEKTDSFQVSNFTAKVLPDHKAVYTFNVIYDPSAPQAACNASSSPSEVDCNGNLCVSYGLCDTSNSTTSSTNSTAPKSNNDTITFSVSPDAGGTGLVVSIQSTYPEDSGVCTSCSKSGLGTLVGSVEEGKDGLQVYIGPGEFEVEAILTVYGE